MFSGAMPRRSRATSAIRRLVAACEISMSDFGLVCWEAGIGAYFLGLGNFTLSFDDEFFWWGKHVRGRSRKAGSCREFGGGGVVSGPDLAAVGRLYAHHLDAAVGAHNREAVGFDGDDLAHLAGDPFGIARRQRLRLEHLEGVAVEGRPGAGRRITAADEVVDLPPRLAPVDTGVVRGAAALIGRLALVLLDARRLAGFDEIDGLQHRLDPHREQAIEIDRAERILEADRRLLL